MSDEATMRPFSIFDFRFWIALLCVVSPALAAAPVRPNILWLIAEDFGPHLGCYGTKQVYSPNLDALAAGGMRFTRCFTTAPVCSPSRSAFMTGMYATTIGAHHHRSHRAEDFPLPHGVRVLTDWMRDAGYFTANVKETPAEWGFKGQGKTDWNFNMPEKPFDSARWMDLKDHQPFFAQINFHETHRVFNGEKKADPAQVEIPPYYPDHPVVREDWAKYLDAASELDRKIGIVLKQLEAEGLAENTLILFFGDNGQAHVRGKQFCYESGLSVPLIVRWPAGMAAPAGYARGQVTDRLVSAIDFAPTMLSLAGVNRPAKMEGRAFLGAHMEAPRQYVFGARDRCDETAMRLRTVRDAQYRYIRNFTPEVPLLAPNAYKERQYPVWNLLKELNAQGKLNAVQSALCAPRRPEEELYDLSADPHEINNLVKSEKPEDQAALRRLRTALEQWVVETGDKGQYPESPESMKAPPAAGKKGKKGK